MYKKSYAQALRQLRVNDIMAVSRVSASEVVDSLFDDQFGLSEDDHSDESDQDCIYGYLGAAVLHRPDSWVGYSSEDEADVEQSLLQGTLDSDDGSGPSSMTNDPDFHAISDEEEDAEHVSPPEQSSSNLPSEALATDDTVST